MKNLNSKCGEGYTNYLKGLYFGILQDCEKKKNYDGLIDAAMVELIGLSEEHDCINLNKLFIKTASLKYVRYSYLRDIIINSCMPLIDSLFKED